MLGSKGTKRKIVAILIRIFKTQIKIEICSMRLTLERDNFGEKG